MPSSTLDNQNHSSEYDINPSIALPFSDPFDLSLGQTQMGTSLSADYSLRQIEAADLGDADLVPIIQGIGDRAREYLRAFASSPAYGEITGLAFGENYNQVTAESLRQRFATGELANLPHLQVLDANIDACQVKELVQ